MLIHSTVILLKKLKCVSSQWLIVELGFPNSTVRTYQSSVLAKCIWFLCDLSEQCYSLEEESFSTIFFGGLCKIYFVITLSGLSHYIQLTINVCTYACSHCLRALLLDIPLGNEKIIEIGRASRRERVQISVVAVSLKKKKHTEANKIYYYITTI